MTRLRILACLALPMGTLLGALGPGSPAFAEAAGGEASARAPAAERQLGLGELGVPVGGAGVGEPAPEASEAPAIAEAVPDAPPAAPDPAILAGLDHADRVVIVKSSRRLYLYRGPLQLRSYTVALGIEPEGPKQFQGDGRTPEGAYLLDYRKERSQYHRAIHISYPRPEDRKRAWAQDKSPGGMIMIHGLPNGYGQIGADHTTVDWTDGCVAVTDEEMDEIWDLVDDGTPIHILP